LHSYFIGNKDGIGFFGQIGEFVSKQEEWVQYVERLEHYLCANAIDVLGEAAPPPHGHEVTTKF